LSPMLIALGAMFVQQTFASVGKTLPAVIAPLVIAELHADPAWVGVYYGLSAAASLFAQMGCGSFIIRYGALRMSQVALVLLGVAMACVAGAAMLQPLRTRFDADRVPSRRFRLSDFRATIASVLTARDLRGLSFACFAFNGIQSVFTAYFVTYLAALGYELVAAGFLFSLVVAVAVPCRVLWGWLGSFYIAPRLVMAGLALGMAGSVALTGLFSAAWPIAAVGLVGAVVSATAVSWHGILLSETARLAPAGRVGAVTGGVLSFGQIGA